MKCQFLYFNQIDSQRSKITVLSGSLTQKRFASTVATDPSTRSIIVLSPV